MKATDVFTALRDPARSTTEKSALLINAITNGIDNVNAQDRLKGTGMEKWSILHHAVSLGNPTALRAVLNAPHIKLHTIDKSGSSPLHLAARSGNEKAVADLLDKQQQMHPDDARSLANYVNATNNACRTPMHLAATAPEGVKVMQRLFDAGGEVEPTTRTGLSTPLSYAVKAFSESGHHSIEATQWLMAHGANKDSQLLVNKTNRTVAAAEAHADIAGNWTTPVKIAQENGWTELLSVLDPAIGDAPSGSAISDPEAHPGLTEDGYLDVNFPVQEHLRALATRNTTPERIHELARLYCIEVYDDTGNLFDGSDPYYTCKDLARAGIVVDIDHDDLMSASKEHICDNLTDWLDDAIPLVAKDIQSRFAAGISDFSEADSELKDTISDGLRSHCLGVMEQIARDW